MKRIYHYLPRGRRQVCWLSIFLCVLVFQIQSPIALAGNSSFWPNGLPKGTNISSDILHIESHPISLGSDALFDTGSCKINNNVHPSLRKIIDFVRRFDREGALKVVGHTDSQVPAGDSIAQGLQYNISLSLCRAQAVVTWLKSNGLQSNSFVIKGVGPMDPLVQDVGPNGFIPSAGKINRRVEVSLLS